MNHSPGIRPVIVIAALVLLSAACHGQSACPWLTAATASGLLGGPSTLSAAEIRSQTGVCHFRSSGSSEKKELRIAVTAMPDIQSAHQSIVTFSRTCRVPAVPLRGIGTSSMLCPEDRGRLDAVEVIGQVRNSLFTVTLVARSRKAARSPGFAERAEMAAEQVAGSLF